MYVSVLNVLLCAYAVVGVWVLIKKYKSDRLLHEMIEALIEENDLIAKQNKMLRDVIRKYGIETAD